MTAPVEEQPPPPEDPPAPYTVELRDASMTRQWDIPTRTYRCFTAGQATEERPFTDAENAWADRLAVAEGRRTNEAELRSRARAALTTNRSYLDAVAAGTATQATHLAQVGALTRQMQGLIRLIVGSDLLDEIGG
ncbi:hypothetical protein STRCI_001256 [Streptomyces cinnabarinus]|uniref:Uncharacterized protein n=1 Tax=Streptomyces cinnabarinus TaxID=67287 RepID=A0ABY7KA10_9ACTN|nr:hypothetical protein [Streptomyces cinnabarinus]WAZ20157.1 hypothetical protein STRCI_001256 [Streptomyces cinnabarinus]